MRPFFPLCLWLIVAILPGCEPVSRKPHWTEASIDRLFEKSDPFELCDGVFCALADVTGNRIDAANEPEPSRTVTLVWHSTGLIGNGGFKYLFEGNFNGDPGYRMTAASFERIEAPNAAAAFRAAFALFPNGQLPTDVNERLRIYESHPEETRDAIDIRFFKAEEEIKRQLAAYIRNNKADLKRILMTLTQ